MASGNRGESDLTGLTAARLEEAMARFAVLKPHLEDGATVTSSSGRRYFTPNRRALAYPISWCRAGRPRPAVAGY